MEHQVKKNLYRSTSVKDNLQSSPRKQELWSAQLSSPSLWAPFQSVNHSPITSWRTAYAISTFWSLPDLDLLIPDPARLPGITDKMLFWGILMLNQPSTLIYIHYRVLFLQLGESHGGLDGRWRPQNIQHLDTDITGLYKNKIREVFLYIQSN